MEATLSPMIPSLYSGTMTGFVAYYRVSTDRQGQSGLGLDAQREAVAGFVRDHPLLATFEEIESGKRSDNRPELAAAIELCRKRKATLVIAKLDRLARDVHFVSGLMKSGVQFVAVDMPFAEPLTIHIIAAMAEHERRMISARTKAALAEVKRRGGKLGNPRWQETIPRAWEATRAKYPLPPRSVTELMHRLRAEGYTLRGIGKHLDSMGVRTVTGKHWHPEGIRDLLNRTNQAQEPQ